MFLFENLTVYKKSLDLVELLYSETKKWPQKELYVLTSQLLRAGTSISLNIAEGNSRSHKEFCHFLDIARGSCFECVAILTIAKRQGYIDDAHYQLIYNHLDELVKMIQGLKKSLR